MSEQITLASAIYPLECLQDAVKAYRMLCVVKVFNESSGMYSVELSRSSVEVDERLLANEFLNYLLDLSLEKHLTES